MFEMTPEHMARTLLVSKGRERARCVKILDDMIESGTESRQAVEALARAVNAIRDTAELQGAQTQGRAPSDGLPQEREIPDDDEAVFLARRFGRFHSG